MGIIWSRFRKKESTKERLQKIQEEITCLEQYKEYTEQRRKKLVGSFIAFNIIVIFIAAVVFYFYYLPPTWTECFIKATPFAGFILLIYMIKSLLTCYYRWKMRRNENKLVSLKQRKEQIIDDVMETETYKVAKEILETYAPEQFRRAAMSFKSPVVTPAVSSHRMPMQQSGELRRRVISPQHSQSFGPRAMPAAVRTAGPPRPYPYARPTPTPLSQSAIAPRPIAKDVSSSSFSSLQGPPRLVYSSASPLNAHLFTPRTDGNSVMPLSSGSVSETPGRPMPRPILPRERGLLERFVEYLVGDGPSNRYALVCRQCESHNGMALKEEFPYIAFRCAYCFYWNPARKQKPSAPRLESPPQRVSLEMTRRLLENEEEESSLEEDGDEEESDTDSSTSSGPSSDNGDDNVNCFINKSSVDPHAKGTKSKEESKAEEGEVTAEGGNTVEEPSSPEHVSKADPQSESAETSSAPESNPECDSHPPPSETNDTAL